MTINEYQKWISQFYKNRNWHQYNPFVRSNFLSEEVGEVCRSIRDIEIGRDRPDEKKNSYEVQLENLTEELGDVLDNIFIIADKYDISLENIMTYHKEKLEKRYSEEKVIDTTF
ncbi:hypothetical protein Si045_01081 [Streptococcus infantarius subsp. infantarius]|uniref:MazG-like family protein n=1 Tax=Enterococcus italicus TaxID=246144 RepID=UPI00207485E1|nr:MazG-like family protein [Enterococcus italicus]MCO4616969.1 hypothetical protein [Streptococcus infantarius subsp. infantarius]MCO4619760.1 hypothetical protein [Streptococcus infantarius subsp. infantarius]